MSDQFIGEIRAFAFNFAPQQWAYCYGQKASIQQYTALYAVIGSHFGPTDHKTYFSLPDLTGRAVMHTNITGAPGLSIYTLAQTSGMVSVAITNAQMPNHTHQASAPQVGGLQANTPTALAYPSVPRITAGTTTTYDAWTTGTPNTRLHDNVLAPAGGTSPHSNTSPYLALNFCIALDGYFPVQN